MTAGAWVAMGAGIATGVAVAAAWLFPRRRLTPAEKEQRRRMKVSAHGRIGSATITDFHDGIISYTYTVGGVEHSATQDLSALSESLPQNLATLIARPASLKYLPGNPANSILCAEDWTGLRFGPPAGTAWPKREAPASRVRNSAE